MELVRIDYQYNHLARGNIIICASVTAFLVLGALINDRLLPETITPQYLGTFHLCVYLIVVIFFVAQKIRQQ